jgi:F-type H+-transporting ATPase subunit delta
MFVAERWAGAFAGVCGEDAGEGLAALRVFAALGGEIPGALFGSGAAAQLDRVIRNAIEKAGPPYGDRGTEFALRLTVLLVKKGLFKYINSIIAEVEAILDRKNRVTVVIVESAFPPDGELQAGIVRAVKRRTGVAEVKLQFRIIPELIGGCRLRMGGEFFDASIRGQLQKMAEELAGL